MKLFLNFIFYAIPVYEMEAPYGRKKDPDAMKWYEWMIFGPVLACIWIGARLSAFFSIFQSSDTEEEEEDETDLLP